MMEIIGRLGDRLLVAIQPIKLAASIVGQVRGLFPASARGLRPVTAVAVPLLATSRGPPTSSTRFLAAIYHAGMYGAARSPVALGVPGVATAGAPVGDGKPLAMQGRASVGL